MTDILQQRRSYRRGLILGLTMAESVILIIFALLLALAASLRHKDQSLDDMTQQIEKLRQQVAEHVAEERMLRERLATIQALAPQSNDFDERFKELVLMKRQAQRVPELEEQIAGLAELQQAVEKALERAEATPAADQTLAERIEQLGEHAMLWEQLAKSLSQFDAKIAPHELEQRLAALLALESAISVLAPGAEPTQAARALSAQIEASSTQIATLQGQMANLRRRCEAAGKGTEKPPCWATSDGRPEYIFNVALRPGGLMVRDNALPHRAEEQRQLPLGSFSYNREVSPNQFRVAARPLREWSQQHDCTFFVRIQDQTGPSQKAVYKQKLRTVGEYFYYYEPP